MRYRALSHARLCDTGLGTCDLTAQRLKKDIRKSTQWAMVYMVRPFTSQLQSSQWVDKLDASQ